MNEKLYKFLVNSCNKPTIVVDISGVILFYNKSAQNLFNIQEDYTLLFDLLNEDSIKDLREAIKYVRETDEELEIELKLDNKESYVLRILKIDDKDYQEVYLCTFEKIKKSLYDIKTFSGDNNLSLNQFLKYLIEYSSDLIFIVDGLGFIQDVSESFCKLIEKNKEDILYTSFYNYLNENERIFFQNTIKNGKEFELEELRETYLEIGNKIDVKYYFLKIEVEDKENYLIICIPLHYNTITIETSNKVIDINLLRNILHDVNTPINVILLFIKEIYDSITNPSDEQEINYNIIEQNSNYLYKILNTFAEFISLIENDGQIQLSKFIFIDIYPDIEEEINNLSSKYNIEFSFAKMTTTAFIQNDKDKLLSLIKNFLNIVAIAQIQKIIFFSAYQEGEYFIISVKDNFTKASDDFLKIFSMLFVENNDKTRKDLGISKLQHSLVLKLIDYLGLKLIINNSEFGISIPLSFQNSEKDEVLPNSIKPEVIVSKEDNSTEGITKQPVIIEKKNYEDLSCIYIEDQVDSQLLFKSQFSELKRVDFSTSFEDAIPMIKSYKYDFVVLDINLEGEYNGIDAMKIIRNTKGYENVLIVGATAFLMSGDKDMFLRAGFDDFVPKPVTKDKLYPILKNRFNF